MDVETPISFTFDAVVVQGGALKEAWVVPAKKIGSSHFLKLQKRDRKFAKVLGFPATTSAKHYGNSTFMEYIGHLRDEKVNQIIKEYLQEDDPQADVTDESVDVGSKQRHKLFVAANVPEVLEVVYPAFTAKDGSRLPDTIMKVISTPQKRVTPTVEISPVLWSFLSVAAHNCDFVPPTIDPDEEEEDDLDYRLDEPNVRWSKRHGAWQLASSYRIANGKWATQYKKVHLVPDDRDEVNNQIIARQAKELQMWHDRHHNQEKSPEPPAKVRKMPTE